MARLRSEIVAWLKVLESSVLYATIVVTFGVQVASVDGQSMDPTLKDQDRFEIIPAGYCFVLGDNRSNSTDSRILGFVPEKYIIVRIF